MESKKKEGKSFRFLRFDTASLRKALGYKTWCCFLILLNSNNPA